MNSIEKTVTTMLEQLSLSEIAASINESINYARTLYQTSAYPAVEYHDEILAIVSVSADMNKQLKIQAYRVENNTMKELVEKIIALEDPYITHMLQTLYTKIYTRAEKIAIQTK